MSTRDRSLVRASRYFGMAAALAVLLAASANADVWAPGTVWPARVPLRVRVQLSQEATRAWMAKELGRSPGEITDEDAFAFLSGVGHALGSELGDVEEALALREETKRTEGIYRVWIVARNAMLVADQAEMLRQAELFQRAVRISADVGWAAGEDVAARVAQNPALALLGTAEWGSVETVLGQVQTLAALDPGWLLRTSPAFNAWRNGPGRGRNTTAVEATRALGVYTDPVNGPYAAWDGAKGEWGSALLFQGQVVERGQPLPLATAIVRLAAPEAAPAEDRRRLDAAATGPDGTFLLAFRGQRADRYADQAVDLRTGVRKWGYEWVSSDFRLGRARVTDVGQISLQRSADSQERIEVAPDDLLLNAPKSYRVLSSSTTDDGGSQRFFLHRLDRLPGSNRQFSSSSEIVYSFDRNEKRFDSTRWLQQTLDPDAAQRARRTIATKSLKAQTQATSTGGQTVVTESGEWKLDDGTTVYHTSQVRIVAILTQEHHARLQLTAIGSSNRADNRDPQGIITAAEALATDLARQIESKLRTGAPATAPEAGTWLQAERLTRLYANVLGLEIGSILLENGQFDPLSRHMPLARQTIRIEERPATFAVSDGVQVVAEPNSLVRFSGRGRLRLVQGRFQIATPAPSPETDQHLQHLGWLIHQAQQAEEDFQRSVERAVRLAHISPAYGTELMALSRDSTLRSLYANCEWLANDDALMLSGRVPILVFGKSELLIEPGDVATLRCLSGRAFLAESDFIGIARLIAGEASTSRPGEPPTAPGAG